jgi:hypothetical protein
VREIGALRARAEGRDILDGPPVKQAGSIMTGPRLPELV